MSTSLRTYAFVGAVVFVVGVVFHAGDAAGAAPSSHQSVQAPVTEPAPVELAPAFEVRRTAEPATEPTAEPTTEPGDSTYVPSTDDCGPDAYRIEPGTCEQYVDGPAIPDPYTEPEIGYVGATFILEPCTHEDGSGQVACYWDAEERGNGQGRSFVMLEGVAYFAG